MVANASAPERGAEVPLALVLEGHDLVRTALEGELETEEPHVHPALALPARSAAERVDIEGTSRREVVHHDREVQHRVHMRTLPPQGPIRLRHPPNLLRMTTVADPA